MPLITKSTFIPADTPPPTLHHILHIALCLLLFFFFIQPRLCQFLHLPSSSQGPNSFSPPLRSPTFLSLRFSTPVSAFLASSRRNAGGVWNIYGCEGNAVTERGTTCHSSHPYFVLPDEQVGGSAAQRDDFFPVPLKAGFVCVQGTMNLSVRMSRHTNACLSVVSLTICSHLSPSTSALATIATWPIGMTTVCQGSSDTSQT